MKVIINGDDLAYSKKENDAIFDCLDRRIISSATIMANAPAFKDAVPEILLRQNDKNISFGVHLNLTEFSPLTNRDIFHESFFFRKKIKTEKKGAGTLPAILRHAVLDECTEQISKIMDHGIRVSHIDSHHHIHTQSYMLFLMEPLVKKFHINKWRITKNLYTPSQLPGYKLRLLKKIWNTYLRFVCHAKTAELFTEFYTFMETYGMKPYEKIYSHTGSIELMVHPGKDSYFEETELLKKTDFEKLGVELISYNDI